MKKEAFLADTHVNEMRPWVVARFDSTSGWTHTYIDRRTGNRWSCDSLTDAFRQYRWNRESWRENKTRLDSYRRDLREAVGNDDVDRAADACERILRWGGVWALRDASRNGLRFPRLRPSPSHHTAQLMRANWFLRSILETGAWPSRPGEDGCHELAAGLFMVGYDVREAA